MPDEILEHHILQEKGAVAPSSRSGASTAGHVNQARGFFLAEVQRATNGYEKKIGEGGFGLVYHGKLPDGSEVAVKVNSEKSGQGTTEFINEVRPSQPAAV